MLWIWLAGAAVLTAGALLPVLGHRKSATVDQLDRARSLASELETAIDTTVGASAAVEEANRYLLLAGAALGSTPSKASAVTAAQCRRSVQWSRKGMVALAR